jgi:isopenicillin-N epimerase
MKLQPHWTLDPEIVYLNHGSFGACPAPIQRLQSELRGELEREPVSFLVRTFPERMAKARNSLARFVHADPRGLAFVPNATTAINTVLRSLAFDSGDEIVVTNMGYGAVNNAAEFVARRSGAKVVKADIPFPLTDQGQILEAFEAALGPRTKAAIFDHITSPTALVLPIDAMVELCEQRGILSIVDGAHAVGQLSLDLKTTGASYYTSNCHKWLCAPKGCAFLYVREDRRDGIHPLSISHGYGLPEEVTDRFEIEFDWPGTHDPTPYLCVPELIEFMESQMVGGWPALMRRNHTLVLEARALLCKELGLEAPCPASMLGAMATLVLPDSVEEMVAAGPARADPLQVELFEEHGFETWLMPYPQWPQRVLRLSAQIYNDLHEYERLAKILAPRLSRPGPN